MVKLLQWSSPWPLAVLCWPEFSLGLPQIRWHPKVGGSVVRLSSTLTELASTRDSWTLCAAPAPASVPGHCQTGARADTRVHTSTRTHTHMFQTREDRLEAKEMSITVESSEVKNKNVLKTNIKLWYCWKEENTKNIFQFKTLRMGNKRYIEIWKDQCQSNKINKSELCRVDGQCLM